MEAFFLGPREYEEAGAEGAADTLKIVGSYLLLVVGFSKKKEAREAWQPKFC